MPCSLGPTGLFVGKGRLGMGRAGVHRAGLHAGSRASAGREACLVCRLGWFRIGAYYFTSHQDPVDFLLVRV